MRRNTNLSGPSFNEDQDMFDAKDEHSQVLEYSDNESSNEKNDFSIDEVNLEEEVGEYQEHNFVLANPRKNNDSIVSSITQEKTPSRLGTRKNHMLISFLNFRKKKGISRNYQNKLARMISI